MHVLLNKLLRKYNLSSFDALESDDNPMLDERSTFRAWDKILRNKELTLEDLESLCQNEIERIEKQWEDMDNSHVKNERLIILHTVWTKIRNFISAPEKEKQALESYLTSLLDKNND